jgi:hypothetical protein
MPRCPAGVRSGLRVAAQMGQGAFRIGSEALGYVRSPAPLEESLDP